MIKIPEGFEYSLNLHPIRESAGRRSGLQSIKGCAGSDRAPG
jgi:hypothetical protein